MKEMDINGDGKISLDEFKYWWQYSKKGQMKRLVGLKFKAMKLIHKVGAKVASSSVDLKVLFGLIEAKILTRT